MAWTIDDMPDQTGRVAVVTGANGGLGLESAKALAGAGAHVVMAARNQQKAAAAMEEILRQHPQASLEIVGLDLGSFESTKTAAATIAAAHPVVDILINNAGLMALPERRTVDGYEMQLGVNHLGHWIFTAGLLASLAAADSARVVTVTSVARLSGNPVDPENVNMEDTYDAWGAYGRSKLANFHFALGLQRHFERHGLAVESLSAHPGLSNTDLQSNTVEQGGGGSGGTVSHWMANRLGMSADDGARSQLRAATDPTARGGELYGPRWGMSGAPVRKSIRRRNIDRDVATLWEVSERETGVRFEFEAVQETR